MSKPIILGSVEWLELARAGAFERPPVPWEPSPKHIPARKLKSAAMRAYPPRPGIVPFAKREGMPCAYRKRPMSYSLPGLRPTKDHVEPRCKGGTRKVLACITCNHMKGSMGWWEWCVYMSANPMWWVRIEKSATANKEQR